MTHLRITWKTKSVGTCLNGAMPPSYWEGLVSKRAKNRYCITGLVWILSSQPCKKFQTADFFNTAEKIQEIHCKCEDICVT